MNILILSAGTRNKIIQYFKRELNGNGKVIATDCSELAPAIYEADKHFIVKKMTEPGYIEQIFDICKSEQIAGILSLIDPELSLLAKNRDKFAEIGVTVIGSSYELCEMSLNKFEMYKWLSIHNYKTAKSYIDINEFCKDFNEHKIDFPVFVKPYDGSASTSIHKVENIETLENLFSNEKGLMIQEFLNGQEIGADVYIDMINRKVVSIFTKKKLKMRAGETDKAISFKDEKLFELIKSFVEEAGYIGQIDIDIFEINGEYYISEVNPRFGGGYPHAYECGVNNIKFILNNLVDQTNTSTIGNYDENVYMMKYNEIKILKKEK